MATIQVDGEVEEALARRASKEGLSIFSPSTPNRVLRIVLGLEKPQTESSSQPPQELKDLSTFSKSANGGQGTYTASRTHQRIGPRLLREHSLSAAKGYFSKTGIPYQKPNDFPAVFFDPNGYFVVDDEASMASNQHINVGRQVSIPKGIASLEGYQVCSHLHS